jgi:hypothetical protein
MRTKTILLSALLGSLGSVSLMAQSTNVYSLNAVGYINVTVQPGFNIVSCPLISVDTGGNTNAISNILNNATGTYKKWQYWGFSPAGGYKEELGTATGWNLGGVSTLAPGEAAWLFNPGSAASNITFVGTVPSGTLVNTLTSNSFNLVSSILPTSGDIITNPLMTFTTPAKKDQVWTYTAGTGGGYKETIFGAGSWNAGDPVQATIGGGFWYFNAQTTNNNWIENFSVGQ